MLQRAQGEAVVEIVQSVVGEPPDVRGVQTHRRPAGLTVVVAERAAPVPRFDDRGPPSSAAAPQQHWRLQPEYGAGVKTGRVNDASDE